MYLICQNVLEREEEERPLYEGNKEKMGRAEGGKKGGRAGQEYQEIDKWKTRQRREGERWEGKQGSGEGEEKMKGTEGK